MVAKKAVDRFLPKGTLRRKTAKTFYLLFFNWEEFKKGLCNFGLRRRCGTKNDIAGPLPKKEMQRKRVVSSLKSVCARMAGIMKGAPYRSSIVTRGKAVKAFVKSGVTYWRCEETGTIFSKPLDQSNRVGGCYEVERNNEHDNIERIRRVKMITGKPHPKVLDYGCGNGMLVKSMNENGCEATGYDAYNPEFDRMSAGVDCVTMIEVVEHFSHPFKEFDEVYDSLLEGGKVYIETSFADWLSEEDSYIDPNVGHSTIFTHKGLDVLMQSKGFKILPAINRNVRLYEK